MTIVYGEIESLSRLKSELKRNGISRFSSIAEINRFLDSYPLERQGIINQALEEFTLVYNQLDQLKIIQQIRYNSQRSQKEESLKRQIEERQHQVQIDKEIYHDSVVRDFIHWIKTLASVFFLFLLRKGFSVIIWMQCFRSWYSLKRISSKHNSFLSKKELFLKDKQSKKLHRLDQVKATLDNLYPLISGAIGEAKVAKELMKLSDDYVLINNFSMSFDPPIYNRKEDDKIFSIQVDHLLVSKAGIFIIETKNWSKQSVNDPNMRSPIQQIRRTGFALFVFLNGKGNGNPLNPHHWGKKEIPLRQVVVMIHHQVKDEYPFVKVKTLKELNSYISYFKPVLSNEEVKILADYLR